MVGVLVFLRWNAAAEAEVSRDAPRVGPVADDFFTVRHALQSAGARGQVLADSFLLQ